jgi:hypothetical protein
MVLSNKWMGTNRVWRLFPMQAGRLGSSPRILYAGGKGAIRRQRQGCEPDANHSRTFNRFRRGGDVAL